MLVLIVFAKSRAIRTCHVCQPGLRGHVLTYQRAKSVAISHFYLPTGQRTNKRARVPKMYQLLNLACQRAKGVPMCQFG